MKANWQQVRQGGVHSAYAGLYVTLNPKGQIKMGRSAYHKMGAPEAVQLFFDAANNRIALKPAAKSARDAYLVGPGGRCGARQVRALRLLNEFAIDLPATVRFYDAEIDHDGLLILDLRTARVPPSVISQQRRLDRQTKRPTKRDPTSEVKP